ncbi:MAG: hypothetical protein ABI432_15020, partial [Flavobacteriales bacterium]
WSGLFVLMGLTIVLPESRDRWWAARAGVLLTIAVWIRPPVALIALGLFLWMRLVRKDGWRDLLLLIAGAATAMILSIGIDSLFYGTPTCSILRFAQVGFVGDPNHVFDTLPWYYYLPWLVKYAIPPIGLCLLLAMAILLWKRPRHFLVWSVLPFLLIHSILPHKEVRFLYPLADLAPLLLVLGYEELRSLNDGWGWSGRTWRIISLVLVSLLIACDIPGLVVICSGPAGNGRAALARALPEQPTAGSLRVGYLTDPQFAWRIHLPHFYRPHGWGDTIIAIGDTTLHHITADVLIAHPADVNDLRDQCDQQFLPLAQAEPEWTLPLLNLYSWGDRSEPWELYTVEKTE